MHSPMRNLALLALGMLGGALALADDKPAKSTVADSELVSFVQKRIGDWQPTAEERRFDEVGWCHSILEAEKLAKEHNRPIFWFTHDGKMSVGRC
jgi:hypothetical protein